MNNPGPRSTVSAEKLLKLLKCDHKEFRTLTAFSKKNFDWSRAHWYSVKNANLVLLPTNFSTVSYLNLEQFSYNCKSLTPDDYNHPEIFTAKSVEKNPLLEEPSLTCRTRLQEILKRLVSGFYDIVEFTMDWEYQIKKIADLKSWNQFRFQRLVYYCLKKNFIQLVTFHKFEVLIQAMVSHCTSSSHFVVDVYKKISMIFHDGHGAFISELPYECVKFFVKHLKRVGTEFVDSPAEWYVVEELTILAILRGNHEMLKELRALEYPSALLPCGMTQSILESVQNV